MKKTVLLVTTAAIVGGAGYAFASDNSDDMNTAVLPQQTETADSTEGNAPDEQKQPMSREAAADIVREAFPEGYVEEVEKEREHGRLLYEVDIDLSGDDDGDVYVDAYTGEIVWVDDDLRSYHGEGSGGQAASPDGPGIQAEEARQIALDFAGGGYIDDLELERENGMLVYEVEVEGIGDDMDIYIDAETGDVLYHD
ncbi:PepSY domain-containing protein [Alkalicoccus urumqiensis]|uniref:PepSY domain-containing protein n=1 Tax=Alkalicoccus urumqiensis TaxID=1548213 RepID=A0A2P6MI46_ALKUR|nr:PepSY domain-containing protein [Alkalicoccus urumqiensis]PRO65956.1 hypothetical protein C6I21_06535 [Alkalicoccus urumqiensis]